jgi:CBS domain-containing protein
MTTVRPGSQSRIATREFRFRESLYFKPGKADWLAHGLPAIRENQSEQSLTVMDRMKGEVPTCRLDEPLGQIGTRAQQRGFSVCAVVNQHGIVLGLIGQNDWDSDPTASAEQLMASAPTTLRPSASLEKGKETLEKSDRGAVLVTDSDGKLLGAFLGNAAKNQEPGGKQQLPESEVWS